MKKTESPELILKKRTLTAWANLLYKRGIIDNVRLGQMVTLIERLEKGNRTSL